MCSAQSTLGGAGGLVGQAWDVWLNSTGKPTSSTPDELQLKKDYPGERSDGSSSSVLATKCDRSVVATLPHLKAPCYGMCPGYDDFVLVQCSQCGILVKPMAYRHHFNSRHNNLLKSFVVESSIKKKEVDFPSGSLEDDGYNSESYSTWDGGLGSPSSSNPILLHHTSSEFTPHDSFLLSPVSHDNSDPLLFGSRHSCDPCCSKDCPIECQSSPKDAEKKSTPRNNRKAKSRSERNLFEKFTKTVKPSNANNLSKKASSSANLSGLKTGSGALDKEAAKFSRQVSSSSSQKGERKESLSSGNSGSPESYIVQPASSGMKLVIKRELLRKVNLDKTPPNKDRQKSKSRRKQEFFLSPDTGEVGKIIKESFDRTPPKRNFSVKTESISVSDPRLPPKFRPPTGNSSRLISDKVSGDKIGRVQISERSSVHNSIVNPKLVAIPKIKTESEGSMKKPALSASSASSSAAVKLWDTNNNQPPMAAAVCNYGARRYGNCSTIRSGRGGVFVFGRQFDGFRLAVQMAIDPLSLPSEARNPTKVLPHGPPLLKPEIKTENVCKTETAGSSYRRTLPPLLKASTPSLRKLLSEEKVTVPAMISPQITSPPSSVGSSGSRRLSCDIGVPPNVTVYSRQNFKVKTELQEESAKSNYTTINVNKIVAMKRSDSSRDSTPVRLTDFVERCGDMVNLSPVDKDTSGAGAMSSSSGRFGQNRSYTVTSVPITVNRSISAGHPPHNYAKKSRWKEEAPIGSMEGGSHGNSIPLGVPPNMLTHQRSSSAASHKRAFSGQGGGTMRKRTKQATGKPGNTVSGPTHYQTLRTGSGSGQTILIAAPHGHPSAGGGTWSRPPTQQRQNAMRVGNGGNQGDVQMQPGTAILLDGNGKMITLSTTVANGTPPTALVLPNKGHNGLVFAAKSGKPRTLMAGQQQPVVYGCVNPGGGVVKSMGHHPEGSPSYGQPPPLIRIPVSGGMKVQAPGGPPNCLSPSQTAPGDLMAIHHGNSAPQTSPQNVVYYQQHSNHMGRQQPQPLS